MPNKTTEAINQIQQHLAQLAVQQQETAVAIARLARGTSDLTLEAQAATSVEVPLESRVAAFLKERAHSLAELSERSGAKPGALVDILKPWKQDQRVYNMGTEDRPKWIMVPGPNASGEELQRVVSQLIADRPMELQDLATATGVPPNKVSMVLVKMTREGANVVNIGNAKKARWFLLGDVAPKRKR